MSSRRSGSSGVAPVSRFPKGPVLGWVSMSGRRKPGLATVADLPNTMLTSSGRASLYQALQLLDLPPGSTVLVPTYHCPTMVAPVLCAGLTPRFFGIDANGLPRLETIPDDVRTSARAMIVAHYFGVPQNLAEVRRWCDAAGVALIEDCAHALFGRVDDQAVGSWGDYATASISKFLPVPELGLLASSRRRLPAKHLGAATFRAQVKGVVDVLESGATFGRPAWMSPLLRALFALKNRRRLQPPASAPGPMPSLDEEEMLVVCDMGRIDQAPLHVSRWIHRSMPLGRVVRRRQENFALYAEGLKSLPGARPLLSTRPRQAAPYVFPLWVDDGDRVYHALRDAGMPVYRWDRIWPGTPELPGDHGPQWSRHVVQLLCHQDLSREEVLAVIAEIQRQVRA